MPPRSDRLALSRRATLAAFGALAVGACSPYESRPAPRSQRLAPLPKPEPGIDPDVLLAADVLAAERAVLQRVDDTIAAFPRLAPALAGVRATHTAHVDLLEQATPPKRAPSPSPSDTPSAAEPARVPGRLDVAVRALAGAEEELSTSEKQSAFAAESGVFARALASMAAAAAQQAVLVREAAQA